jgi:hypothetical protein
LLSDFREQQPAVAGRRIARGMNPPHLPRRFRAPGRKSVKHRKHRGNANAGAQQDNWSPIGSQNELAARRADLYLVADLGLH